MCVCSLCLDSSSLGPRLHPAGQGLGEVAHRYLQPRHPGECRWFWCHGAQQDITALSPVLAIKQDCGFSRSWLLSGLEMQDVEVREDRKVHPSLVTKRPREAANFRVQRSRKGTSSPV